MNFAVLAYHKLKVNEDEKLNKYLDFAGGLKNESDNDTTCIYLPSPQQKQNMTPSQFFNGV